MRAIFALLAVALLAACDKPAAVRTDTADADMAAAERRAISDTDAALAAARPVRDAGTN